MRTPCLAALVTSLTLVGFPLSAQTAAPSASATPPNNADPSAPPAAPAAPPAPPAASGTAPLPTSTPAPAAPPATATPAAPPAAASAAAPAATPNAVAPATAAVEPPLAGAASNTPERADPTHEAFVHLASNYPGTWLEMRNYVEGGEWERVCPVPCDRTLTVLGIQARVTAEDMSTSNVFRIQPGSGRALVRVDGGSDGSRRLGVLGLAIGIPVALTGMAGLGYGALSERDGMAVAGGIVLGTGGALILASLPLLLLGTTDVRDGSGDLIASDSIFRPAF